VLFSPLKRFIIAADRQKNAQEDRKAASEQLGERLKASLSVKHNAYDRARWNRRFFPGQVPPPTPAFFDMPDVHA
jgi:hypothetical protein